MPRALRKEWCSTAYLKTEYTVSRPGYGTVTSSLKSVFLYGAPSSGESGTAYGPLCLAK